MSLTGVFLIIVACWGEPSNTQVIETFVQNIEQVCVSLKIEMVPFKKLRDNKKE